ncbi:MAG TPA: hypothetical protein VF461_23970 [Gemmatimonadaceae bacterium]
MPHAWRIPAAIAMKLCPEMASVVRAQRTRSWLSPFCAEQPYVG